MLRRIESRDGTLPDGALDMAIEEQFGLSPDVSETVLEDRFLASLPGQAQLLEIGEAILALDPQIKTRMTAERLIAYGRAEGRSDILESALALSAGSRVDRSRAPSTSPR